MHYFLYYTAHKLSNELKVNKTDAVKVCLFIILLIEQIILNPVTVAKHLFVLTVLEDSCVVIFAKINGSSQPNTAAGHYAEIVTGCYFSILARQAVSSRTTLN